MGKTVGVILAAGKGTRMKSDIPKVLHRAGAATLLERVIDNLREAGIEDLIVVTGHGAEMVEGILDGRASAVRQGELLGSGHAVACCRDEIEKKAYADVIVTCGDAPLIKGETYRDILEKRRSAEAACVLLTAKVDEPFSYGRVVRSGDGAVEAIVEEKDLSPGQSSLNEVNTGTYCFEGGALVSFIDRIEMNENKKEFYLTDVVSLLRKNGKKVAAAECRPEEAVGVNSRKDLAFVSKLMNRSKIEELMESGVTVVDPDNTYIERDAVIGKDTVVLPGVVIEENVVIGAACTIGPSARLRPGTRLADRVEIGNFAELCRTEVGEGTKIKHQCYLGDTVIGRGVNIGAGAITANYDGREKHRTSIGDKAFIGVGAILVAPVNIGVSSVVGAGCVVPKNRDVAPGETVVGVPSRPLSGRGGGKG